MNQKHILTVLFAVITIISCGDNAEKAPSSEGDSATPSSASSETSTNSNPDAASTTTVSANDAAIAVIEDNKVRLKLHALIEVVPDPLAPGKPTDGKKVFAADISAEYLEAHNTSPAEYMLTSYIVDDKGNKHSLPKGSIRLAMVVSEAQAQQDNNAGAAFNQSNVTAGQKFRGRQYGFEMDAGNKPVRWGMRLNGKDLEVAIGQ